MALIIADCQTEIRWKCSYFVSILPLLPDGPGCGSSTTLYKDHLPDNKVHGAVPLIARVAWWTWLWIKYYTLEGSSPR